MAIQLDSRIQCPHCGFSRTEQMPTDACVWFWECPECGVLMKPKPGDCCVYCSYADTPCPPIQAGDGDCCQSNHEVNRS
jgi:DNA-directed RNA polymerase subunit RPC12/RpoP